MSMTYRIAVLFALCITTGNLLAQQAPATAPSVTHVLVGYGDGTSRRFVPASQPHAPTTQRALSLLGVNVESLRDHARSNMFIDAIKTARPFGSPAEPWAGRAKVDADGWPVEDFGVVVMTEAVNANGTYRLSCRGFAQVKTVASKASIRNWQYDQATDTSTADVVLVADPTVPSPLHLSFTQTRGGVRALKLLRPGYTSDEPIFTNEFLAALEPFGTIRFMDYLRTNHSTVATWSDRAKPTDAQYTLGRGGPFELAIALGNRTGKDIWLNIPIAADDQFVEELARLVDRSLSPDLNCYIEYSNEIWNGIFPQEQINLDLAKAEVAAGDTTLSNNGSITNPYYVAWRRVGKRSMEISAIFRRVCGPDPRFRVVLCGQHVRPLVLKKGLEYIREYGGEPRDYLYGVATAPYFGNVKDVLARTDLTVDDVCAVLQARVTAGNNVHVQNLLALAKEFGLKPMAYEGGVDLGQGTASLDAKIAAQSDPRTGAAVEQYLRNWFSAGGGPILYYNLTNRYTKSGFWGLTDDVTRLDGPKMQAARRVAGSVLSP